MPVMLKDFEIPSACRHCKWRLHSTYDHPVFGITDFYTCTFSDEVIMTEGETIEGRSLSCPFREVRYLENDEYAKEGCNFV